MIDVGDVRSLTEFKRNASAHLARLKKSGRPQVITVNGKAAFVVQDVAAYQQLLDSLDEAEAIAGIQRGLDSMARGEGQDARKWMAKMRRKHRIPRMPRV